MEEKQVRRKKRAFVALLFPALLFFLVSPFAVPASALTYELGLPSFVQNSRDLAPEGFWGSYYSFAGVTKSGDLNYVAAPFGSVPSQKGGLNFIYNDTYDYISRNGLFDGFDPIEDRPLSYQVFNVSSSISGGLPYQFWFKYPEQWVSAYRSGVLMLKFQYPEIKVSNLNTVFQVTFSYDYFMNGSHQDAATLGVNEIENYLAFIKFNYRNGTSSGSMATFAPTTVVKIQTNNRSYQYTCYFDFSLAETFEGYESISSFNLVLTYPCMLPFPVSYGCVCVKGNAALPLTYDLIAQDQMEEQVAQISQQIDQLETTIETSINNQTTQIISGVSNVIQEQLIDNTDPERQAINQEAETNIDRLKDVGDQYESQNAIVDEARRNLESIAPVTLPPEASEFISTTGEILSSPWILTLTTIGLTLGIIRIILIGVYH